MPCSTPCRRPRPLLALVLITACLTSHAATWPQYRGPSLDGSTPEQVRTNWAAQPPAVLWRRPLEPGWSSCVTDGVRLYTQVRRASGAEEREFTVALDPATGAELWARNLSVARYDNLSGYDDNLDGPRSTPTVAGGRVFVLTSQLRLACLDAASGAIVWTRDFPAENPQTQIIAWQNAASPLVVGDLLFLNANTPGGRMTAIRIADGSTAWRAGEDITTHASPALATWDGEDHVVFLTLSGLVGLEARSGAARWRLSFSPSSTSTAATPVVDGTHVYASAAYSRGAWSARVTRDGTTWRAEQAWRQQGNSYQNHWATPVAYQGHLYSVAGPSPSVIRLACIEAATGALRWSQTEVGSGRLGFGSVIRAADHLLVLTESGELVLVRASPERYEELGRLRILSAHCWNHPALANGRLYARSSSELVAVDLAPALPPIPPLTLTVRRPADLTDAILLEARAASGQPLTADMVDRLQILAVETLGMPASGWPPASSRLTPAGDAAIAEVPLTGARQFLIVRERP